ncbi:hypothetical protein [Acinetobacter calcoaceticus]|uniref:hypothetical protein n=1 Tax=Acinetobacter calcoaceticus TaxID=471 RepID=UPI003AF4D70E
MTVQVTDRLSQLYVGNGVNTRFDFTFRIFDQEDETGVAVRIKVGNEFEFLDETKYTVTINPDNLGGYLNFLDAPDAQTYFYIAGKTPVDQLLDITNYDNFYPDVIERALDKLTAILQEWKHLVDFETQARILADLNYDQLAQQREAELKAYIDGIASAITGQPVLGLPAQFVVDGAKNQKQINNDLKNLYNPLTMRYTSEEIANAFTIVLNSLIAEVASSGGGVVSIPDGNFSVNAAIGIELRDNIHLRMGHNTFLKALPNNLTNYEILRIHERNNVIVSGGKISGNRQQSTAIAGEWGMGISIKSSRNVAVRDITIRDCWGDGIYIGKTGNLLTPLPENGGSLPYCENVYLENIVCDYNRRQGISVISLKDSVWNNIRLVNTIGTPPADGVDFEPNDIQDVFENIEINGLVTENNSGQGVQLYLAKFLGLKPNYAPSDWNNSETNYTPDQLALIATKFQMAANHVNKVSITINNWNHKGGGSFSYRGAHSQYLQGFITINNSSVINSVVAPCLDIGAHHADEAAINIKNTTLVQTQPSSNAHIRVDIAKYDDYLGGLYLENVQFKGGASFTSVYAPVLLTDSSAIATKKFKNVSLINCSRQNSSIYDAFLIQCAASIVNFLQIGCDASTSGYIFGANATINPIYKKTEHKKPVSASNTTLNITSANKNDDFIISNFENTTSILNVTCTIPIDGYPLASTSFSIFPGTYIRLKATTNNRYSVVSASKAVLRSLLNWPETMVQIPTQNITSGSSVSAIVDRPNANIGDPVFSYCSVLLNSLNISAEVTAIGKVTITVKNNTGATIQWGGWVGALLI